MGRTHCLDDPANTFHFIGELENTVPGQIDNIDAVICLFADASRATESRSDAKFTSVIQALVNRALVKGLLSAKICPAVEKAVHKCVPERPRVGAAAARVGLCHLLGSARSQVFKA